MNSLFRFVAAAPLAVVIFACLPACQSTDTGSASSGDAMQGSGMNDNHGSTAENNSANPINDHGTSSSTSSPQGGAGGSNPGNLSNER